VLTVCRVMLPCGWRSLLALTATIYKFDIDLADADRRVYEPVALQVARHPSESEAHLVARVLAYALEFTGGIALSRGLSEPEEPSIAVRDLTGAIRVWIEVGMPDAARLHKACKIAPRVVVYTHKDPAQLVGRLAGERIHRAEAIELYAIDRSLIAALVARLDRRMGFALSVAGGELYVSLGTETLSGAVVRHLIA
jgi:uncharacterized protein YaeQ